MTSQALNRPVDVLVTLDALLTFASRGVERDDPALELIEAAHEARAAVAELIAASRDLQDAMDEDDSNPLNPGPAARFHAADARHRAALAAVEGKA